jgi:hypothetical protein
MSRDSQRYRKTYSYYRVQPKTEQLEVIVDENLDWKNSVRAASTGSHSLTGVGTSLSIGGVTIINEDRVLLKDQGTTSQNGIYYFEVTGGNYALTRASDARDGTLSCGAATYVEEGTNAGKIYILSTTNPIAVDSTSLTWTELSSGGGGGGLTGSGTDGYLAQWSGGTTTLGDSFIQNFSSNVGKYKKNYHYFEDQTGGGTYVYIKSNNADEGKIGINVNPSFALDIVAGANSINEAVRVRNNNSSQGTGVRQTFIAGNYSEPTFRITHAWPSNAEGHYTFLGITKPTPSAGTPSIAERLSLYSSGSVEVSGSFVARLDPEIINKPIMSVQKSNGKEVFWVSSSAGSHPAGTDIFMWVSGSRTTNNEGADKVVFDGDVRISGSLSLGTGSVLITSNNVQFGSNSLRIEKNGNDMKFFDLNNAGGVTLSDLASGGGGGGGGSTSEYWASGVASKIYTTGSVGIGTTDPTINGSQGDYNLLVHESDDAYGAKVLIECPVGDGNARLLMRGGDAFKVYGNDAYGATNNGIFSSYYDSAADPPDNYSLWKISGGQMRYGMAFEIAESSRVMTISSSYDTTFGPPDTITNIGVGIGTSSPKATLGVRSWQQNGSAIAPLHVTGYSDNTLMWVSGSGNIGIGTSSVTEKLQVHNGNIKVDSSGYGVRLPSSPSNSDSQTLDSYSESTVIQVKLRTSDGGNVVMESGYDEIVMTRVGRIVTLSGHLKVTSDTGQKPFGSGRLIINLGDGVPGVPLPSKKTGASIWLDNFKSGLVYPPMAYMDTLDPFIYIDGISSGVRTDLGSYIENNAEVIFSVTYAA